MPAQKRAAPRRVTAVEPVAFDVDAARAARAEAEGAEFPFTFNGEVFTIPPAKDWPIRVSSELARGDLLAAMDGLLGPQFDAFMRSDPTIGDVEAIFTAVAAWQDIDLGE